MRNDDVQLLTKSFFWIFPVDSASVCSTQKLLYGFGRQWVHYDRIFILYGL